MYGIKVYFDGKYIWMIDLLKFSESGEHLPTEYKTKSEAVKAAKGMMLADYKVEKITL